MQLLALYTPCLFFLLWHDIADIEKSDGMPNSWQIILRDYSYIHQTFVLTLSHPQDNSINLKKILLTFSNHYGGVKTISKESFPYLT